MKLKKLLAGALSVLMLVTASGCEQSSVAGFDPDAVLESDQLTPEEKEQLRSLLQKALVELEEEGTTATEATAEPEESAEPAAEPTEEATAEPEETPEPEAAKEPETKAALSAPAESEFYALDETGHGSHSLAELIERYRGVDEHALDPYIEALDAFDTENPDSEKPEEEVVQIYYWLLDAYEYEEVQMVISSIVFDLDTTDEEASKHSSDDSNKLDRMHNSARLAVKRALEGPYHDALAEVMSDREEAIYLGTSELSERAEELMERYNEIVSEYKQLMQEPVEVEYEGKNFTESALAEAVLDDDARKKINTLLDMKRAELVWPLYSELIKNRNEYAKELGYENYMEYAYSYVFDRDYTVADIRELSEHIFDYVSPLMVSSMLVQGDASLDSIEYKADTKEIFGTIRENLTKLDPELSDSIDYLLENELYTAGDEENRTAGAYMAGISAMRSGMIYAKRSNNGHDYETLTHEFGHFNNAYRIQAPALANVQHMDILEIHSQGLEMLGSTTLNNVFPEKTGDFTAGIAFNMTQNITSAIMVACFEIDCFENPDMTYEEASMKFTEEMYKCMTGSIPENAQPMGVWATVHHLFVAPQYYVSYAISALSALDVYAQYLEDPEEGIKKYNALANIDPHMSYSEAMKETGLRDMTKSENIRDVCDELNQHFTEEFNQVVNQIVDEGIEALGNLFSDLFAPANSTPQQ